MQQFAGAAGLAAQLEESGPSLEQLAPFAELFVGFAKENASNDLVERVPGQRPQLRQLVG